MMNWMQSTPTNQHQTLPRRSYGGDEFALPPIDLLRLDRSPLEIFMKKAYSGNSRGSAAPQESGGSPRLKTAFGQKGSLRQERPDYAHSSQAAPVTLPDNEGGDFLEWEIRLRLFYIQQLTCLKQEGKKEKMEEMKLQYMTLDYQLQGARADLACAFEQRVQLKNRLRVLEQDKRHLTTLIKSNDQAALIQLTTMQEQLKKSEGRLEKLAKQVGLQPPASAFTRVFLPHCPPQTQLDLPDLSRPPPTLGMPPSLAQPFPAPETGTRVFTTLIELVGQLSELCKGEFGSKLVVERLATGQEEESRLLWKELGLPVSLPSIMANQTSRYFENKDSRHTLLRFLFIHANSSYFSSYRKVVFALIETWPWAREVLEREMAKQAAEDLENKEEMA